MSRLEDLIKRIDLRQFAFEIELRASPPVGTDPNPEEWLIVSLGLNDAAQDSRATECAERAFRFYPINSGGDEDELSWIRSRILLMIENELRISFLVDGKRIP